MLIRNVQLDLLSRKGEKWNTHSYEIYLKKKDQYLPQF